MDGYSGCPVITLGGPGNSAKKVSVMSVQDDSKIASKKATSDRGPATLSRRAVIRGGVSAMPAILTLQSGAALARSSNLISAASPGTTDRLGRTLCLDTNSVYRAGEYGDTYDLGEPPHAVVNIIRDRKYYDSHEDGRYGDEDGHHGDDDDGDWGDHHGSENVSPASMCREGGTYWYNDHEGAGWQSARLPYNGIVVSSGAMTSVAGYVTDNLI